MAEETEAVRQRQRRQRAAALTEAGSLLYHHPEISQPLIDRVGAEDWCLERGLLELVKDAIAAKEKADA